MQIVLCVFSLKNEDSASGHTPNGTYGVLQAIMHAKSDIPGCQNN